MARDYEQYISLATLRTRCGFDASFPTDDRLLLVLKRAVGILERLTGQEFVLRSKTLKLDGNGTPWLPLPYHLFSITSLKIDDGLVESTDYVLYNRTSDTHADDRRNPRIMLLTDAASVFSNTAIFPRGFQNVEVAGMWGCVDEDGNTPELVLSALDYLVLMHYEGSTIGLEGLEDIRDGATKLRQNKSRRVEYFTTAAPGMLTGDAYIDAVIREFSVPVRPVVSRGALYV